MNTNPLFLTTISIIIISILSLILNYRNLIILILTVELLLMSLCLLLSSYSHAVSFTLSVILILQILTIAAAETAIGLSIIASYYRIRGTIAASSFSLLRG